MRLASLFYAILALTAVSALAVPKPRASIEAPVEARAERRQVGGGFSRSCSDYHIHKAADGDWYIEGTCRNNAGGQTKSGLNLNICLANIKSVLKWQLKFVMASPPLPLLVSTHASPRLTHLASPQWSIPEFMSKHRSHGRSNTHSPVSHE